MAGILLFAVVCGGITALMVILIMAGLDDYDYEADEKRNEVNKNGK